MSGNRWNVQEEKERGTNRESTFSLVTLRSGAFRDVIRNRAVMHVTTIDALSTTLALRLSSPRLQHLR